MKTRVPAVSTVRGRPEMGHGWGRVLQGLTYRLERWARLYVESAERARLHDRHGIARSEALPTDLLRIATTIKAHQPAIRRMIDVGAHRGRFALAMSKAWVLSEIVAVEPNRELRAQLRRVLPDTAKILSVALSGRNRHVAYHLHPDSSMNSLVLVDDEAFNREFYYYTSDKISVMEVQARSMDSLLGELTNRDSRDILLKLDTQGSELDILQSGQELLKLVSACLVEHMFWSGYKLDYDIGDLIIFMREQGFHCVGVLEPQYRADGRSAFADVLFLAA